MKDHFQLSLLPPTNLPRESCLHKMYTILVAYVTQNSVLLTYFQDTIHFQHHTNRSGQKPAITVMVYIDPTKGKPRLEHVSSSSLAAKVSLSSQGCTANGSRSFGKSRALSPSPPLPCGRIQFMQGLKRGVPTFPISTKRYE